MAAGELRFSQAKPCPTEHSVPPTDDEGAAARKKEGEQQPAVTTQEQQPRAAPGGATAPGPPAAGGPPAAAPAVVADTTAYESWPVKELRRFLTERGQVGRPAAPFGSEFVARVLAGGGAADGRAGFLHPAAAWSVLWGLGGSVAASQQACKLAGCPLAPLLLAGRGRSH